MFSSVVSCFVIYSLILFHVKIRGNSFSFLFIPQPSSSLWSNNIRCFLSSSLFAALLNFTKDIRSSCQATQLLQSFLHTTKLLTSSHDNPKHFKSSLIVPHFHASDNIIYRSSSDWLSYHCLRARTTSTMNFNLLLMWIVNILDALFSSLKLL